MDPLVAVRIRLSTPFLCSMTKRSPNLYVIAGPNGAGKTTFANEFLPNYISCPHFVNADMIAQGLSPFSPKTAAIKAGRLLLEQIHCLADKRLDFGFETTLSGKSYFPFFKALKKSGYFIHLFFLWIPGVELSLKRIEDRVSKGGHDVPVSDVRRRFHRSIINFFNLYQPILHSWMLFVNSRPVPRLIAREHDGKIETVDKALFAQIKFLTEGR